MGNCVGGFKQRTRRIVRTNRRTLTIAFLGLDGSGKTTIVKALQGEGADAVHPTMGFSRGEFNLHRTRIVAYDLGGAERIRDIWKIYFAEIYAIVYVVDSAAASRIEENRRLVETLRANADLLHKPIVFLLNKKDLPDSLDEIAFSESFALHAMACTNKTDIRVEGVCAIKGHGKEIDPMIKEAIGWLVEKVGARYELLHKEIETAVEALKERQSRERLDRQHRLAHLSQRETATSEHDVVEREADAIATMAAVPIGLTNGALQSGDGDERSSFEASRADGAAAAVDGRRRRRSMAEILVVGTHAAAAATAATAADHHKDDVQRLELVEVQRSLPSPPPPPPPPPPFLAANAEPDDMLVSARHLDDEPPVASGDVAAAVVAAQLAPLETAMRASFEANAAAAAAAANETAHTPAIAYENQALDDETFEAQTTIAAAQIATSLRPESPTLDDQREETTSADVASLHRRGSSPQPSKIAVATRANNKIQPFLVNGTTTVAAQPHDVDFRIFETGGTKPTRLKTPLRRRSLDTRALFSRGRRPSLLSKRDTATAAAAPRTSMIVELAVLPKKTDARAQPSTIIEDSLMEAEESS